MNDPTELFRAKLRSYGRLGSVLLLITACGGVRERKALTLSEPAAFDEDLVWFDSTGQQALVLAAGVAQPQPKVTSIPLDGTPVAVQRRHENNEILFLSNNEDTRAAELIVLAPSKVKARYEIGTQFDSLSQSADGNYAIAHYSQNGGSQEQGILFNPSEIAIIDLQNTDASAVTKRTLRSFGSGPRSIQFSPPMLLAGELRQLAVIVYQSQIALLDLSHPERPEYTIELSGAAISVRQIRFSAEDQKIYVLADGSNDVFVIRLLDASANRQNDFEPSRNQLGADAAPQDMAVFDSPQGRRLLVASGGKAEIVEASSSRVTSVALTAGANRVLLFKGRSPFDDAVEERALLFAPGQSNVSFLDLDDVEQRTTRNLEVVAVPTTTTGIIQLENNRLLLPQSSGGMTILDLEQRSATPIQARLGLSTIIPSLSTGRLWAMAKLGSSLGYIDVDTLHPGQVDLDEPVQQLFILEQANRVAAVHAGADGFVTLLSATHPEDAKQAISLKGFFAEGALDQ